MKNKIEKVKAYLEMRKRFEFVIKIIGILSFNFFIIVYLGSCKKESVFNNKSKFEQLTNTPRKLIEHYATYPNGETEDLYNLIVEHYEYDCYKENIYEFKVDSIYNNYNICTPYFSKWFFNEDSTYINIWENTTSKKIKEDEMIISEKKILELSQNILKIEYNVYLDGILLYVAEQTYETVK